MHFNMTMLIYIYSCLLKGTLFTGSFNTKKAVYCGRMNFAGVICLLDFDISCIDPGGPRGKGYSDIFIYT